MQSLLPAKVQKTGHEKQNKNVEFIQLPLTNIIRGRRVRAVQDVREEKLSGLIESIRVRGVMQPILVRPLDSNFELLCGERRLLACEYLRMEKIPARVITRPITDDMMVAIELEENLQREDLTPIEEAVGYQQFFLKHNQKGLSEAIEDLRRFEMERDKLDEDAAETVSVLMRISGKSAKTLQNHLLLRRLPDNIQVAMNEGRISATAGYELCKKLKDIDNPRVKKVFDACLNKGLSATQIKESFARLGTPPKRPSPKTPTPVILRDLTRFEELFEEILAEKKGTVTEKQADKLLAKLQDLVTLLNEIKRQAEPSHLPAEARKE